MRFNLHPQVLNLEVKAIEDGAITSRGSGSVCLSCWHQSKCLWQWRSHDVKFMNVAVWAVTVHAVITFFRNFYQC